MFFAISYPKLSPDCRLLCNSLVLVSFYQVHYASSSFQNARTGQICCLFSTSVLKAFSSAPGPRWRALPPEPRYRLALRAHHGLAPSNENFCLRPCSVVVQYPPCFANDRNISWLVTQSRTFMAVSLTSASDCSPTQNHVYNAAATNINDLLFIYLLSYDVIVVINLACLSVFLFSELLD